MLTQNIFNLRWSLRTPMQSSARVWKSMQGSFQEQPRKYVGTYVFSCLCCYKVREEAGSMKHGFILLKDPRISHRKLTQRKFTINIRFNDIHSMDEDGDTKAPHPSC